jgi:hypothetical protein
MAKKVKLPRRVIGLLRWPTKFPDRIKYGQSIIAALILNAATFPNMAPTPATLTSAINALSAAEGVASTHAAGSADARDAKWQAVEIVYDQALAFVQAIADNAGPVLAPSIFAQAGMSTEKVGVHPTRKYESFQELSTEVQVTTPANGPDTAVIWEYSTAPFPTGTTPAATGSTAAPAISWVVTIHGILTLPNQTPGTLLYIRYRVVTTTGYGDWSQTLHHLVT